MDAVIAYVNPMDEYWRVQYDLIVGGAMNVNRYTDFGTLKYVLRGISKNMPYIENVFLIVSSMSQVPEYVDTEKVRVVTHEQFIPKQFLPTFNANTIEDYLWNIPGLGEQFVYFNDDMIPINEIAENEFFNEGLPCISFTTEPLNGKEFSSLIHDDNDLASLVTGNDIIENLRPIHTATPYLKSFYEGFYYRGVDRINSLCFKVRSNHGISQHYFANCLYHINLFNSNSQSFLYFQTNYDLDEIEKDIIENQYQTICINDCSTISDAQIDDIQEWIDRLLIKFLPNKSKYER